MLNVVVVVVRMLNSVSINSCMRSNRKPGETLQFIGKVSLKYTLYRRKI